LGRQIEPEEDIMIRKFGAALLVAAAASGFSPSAVAEDYPSQPIRMVVPFAPGGGNDLLGRVFAEALGPRMGQTVYVDNKPGAGSAIGIDLVAKAKPDGYTILWTASDGVTILPAVRKSVPYKVPDDFSFVARITTLPLFIAVSPQLPIKSLKELIEYGKKNPGKLRYGTAGVAGGPHMATELLANKAGIKMTHVPYQGIGPAMTALAGGFVDLVLAAPSSVKPYADSGKARLLAMSGEKRHPNFPDVPTYTESGLPLTTTIFYGILAPAHTPEPILARLRKEFGEVLKDPKLIDRLDKLGYKPEFLAGDDFKKFLVDELNQWKAVAKAANISIE
jgi:tripartite-type tricarboxylate transporter receptor subunit TctC